MRIHRAFIFLFIVSILVSCSASGRFSHEPSNSGFVDYTDDEVAGIRTEQFPFLYAWINPDLQKLGEHYDTLEVLPVNLEYLELDEWRSSKNPIIRDEKDYLHYTRLVASYFIKNLEKELRTRVRKKDTRDFELIFHSSLGSGKKSTFDEDTLNDEDLSKKADDLGVESASLVMEIAFTEVVFGNPVTHAGTLLVPLPGVSQAVETVSSPLLAFELRVREKGDEEDLFVVADRKYPRTKLIDVNKLTVTSPLREVSDRWVTEFSRTLFRKNDEDSVSGTYGVALLPW